MSKPKSGDKFTSQLLTQRLRKQQNSPQPRISTIQCLHPFSTSRARRARKCPCSHRQSSRPSHGSSSTTYTFSSDSNAVTSTISSRSSSSRCRAAKVSTSRSFPLIDLSAGRAAKLRSTRPLAPERRQTVSSLIDASSISQRISRSYCCTTCCLHCSATCQDVVLNPINDLNSAEPHLLCLRDLHSHSHLRCTKFT